MKSFKHWWIAAGGCLIAVGLSANATRAAYVSSDDHLPSVRYQAANPVTYSTPQGQYTIDSFFDVFTEIERIPSPPPQPSPGPPPIIHSFFDVFAEFDLIAPGAGPVHIRESPTRQTLSFRLNGLPPGEPYLGVRTFDTEMLALDISGSHLPPGVMIRESPSRPSLGQIRMAQLPSGAFAIDSFFDVFTELSVDGGQNWYPGNQNEIPMHLVGTAAPELSSCLVWLVGSMALGYFRFRRSKC